MRIISGKFRSRRLLLPPASITRPTSDRTRESIFNILDHRDDFSLNNAHVADVFAGPGAMGLEALSRGAAHVTFFENNNPTLKILRNNIHNLDVENHTTVIVGDALRPPSTSQQMDICFFDPPYGKFDLVALITSFAMKGWIGTKTLIVYEMSSADLAPEWPDELTLLDNRHYGAAGIYILTLSQ